MGLIYKPYKNTISPLGTLAPKTVPLESYKYNFIGMGTKRAHIDEWGPLTLSYNLTK